MINFYFLDMRIQLYEYRHNCKNQIKNTRNMSNKGRKGPYAEKLLEKASKKISAYNP